VRRHSVFTVSEKREKKKGEKKGAQQTAAIVLLDRGRKTDEKREKKREGLGEGFSIQRKVGASAETAVGGDRFPLVASKPRTRGAGTGGGEREEGGKTRRRTFAGSDEVLIALRFFEAKKGKRGGGERRKKKKEGGEKENTRSFRSFRESVAMSTSSARERAGRSRL